MWFDSMSCLDDEHADIECYLMAARRSVCLSPRDYMQATITERRVHYENMWRWRTTCSPPKPLLRRMNVKGRGPMPLVAHYLAPGQFSNWLILFLQVHYNHLLAEIPCQLPYYGIIFTRSVMDICKCFLQCSPGQFLGAKSRDYTRPIRGQFLGA